jgi:hypothetical protein
LLRDQAGGKFDDKPGTDICGNAQNWGGSFLVTELISNGWLSKDQKKGINGYTRYYDSCSGQVSGHFSRHDESNFEADSEVILVRLSVYSLS